MTDNVKAQVTRTTYETEPLAPVPYTLVYPEPWQTDLIEYLEGWDGKPLFFYKAEDAVWEYGSRVGREYEYYDTYLGSGNPEFILSIQKLSKEELSAIGKGLVEEGSEGTVVVRNPDGRP